MCSRVTTLSDKPTLSLSETSSVAGAVVAREYGLPCIVGCQDATRTFSTGLYVLLLHPVLVKFIFFIVKSHFVSVSIRYIILIIYKYCFHSM